MHKAQFIIVAINSYPVGINDEVSFRSFTYFYISNFKFCPGKINAI